MTAPHSATFHVGTASWTDPSLIASAAFYPPDVTSAEDRLRFYAAQFDTVEVDATYYALLAERNATLWAERTPSDFTFHVKAFALLTTHAADTKRLPRAIKALLSPAELAQPRLTRPRDEVRDLAFDMFTRALEPLRAAGKLGQMVFQFPPWFTATRKNADYIEHCRARLPDDALAIEFRHASWLAPTRQERTLDFLRDHGLTYVIVDEPQVANSVPPVCALTSDVGYVRFHGRNKEAWQQKGISAAERYKYLYAERELAEWTGRLRDLKGARAVHAVFNNCYANFGVMNATTMKQMLVNRES
ncbi:MAG: DUF72 domain-containing protein [Deltaproteobacteria bacterium]|nr:DUF72 domain-containing protein [Deltaproteobacteria bacterium]MBI3389427.1 DUF72 domain-containing protein [Deltaproteobacteria bacterium]